MTNPSIVVVDYGVGNTYSVTNAITSLGYRRLRISDDEKVLRNADALILPGVGAFEACASNLRSRNLDKILNEIVLVNRKPILGICVGMQLMATRSEENGLHAGLNWIPGEVTKLNLTDSFAVPHVGWNNLKVVIRDPLFSLVPDDINFYFDHSYYFCCEDRYVSAYCEYGIRVTAAVQHNGILGVQFHPEKSHNNGLRLFRSFFKSI